MSQHTQRRGIGRRRSGAGGGDLERLGAEEPGPETSDGLTQRECEVLALVAEGHSNRHIGEELSISDRTVARHLTNIFHKIRVTNRTEAALYALEQRNHDLPLDTKVIR
jgi:DNA-binding NarL/FixJ family response regulator